MSEENDDGTTPPLPPGLPPAPPSPPSADSKASHQPVLGLRPVRMKEALSISLSARASRPCSNSATFAGSTSSAQSDAFGVRRAVLLALGGAGVARGITRASGSS